MFPALGLTTLSQDPVEAILWGRFLQQAVKIDSEGCQILSYMEEASKVRGLQVPKPASPPRSARKQLRKQEKYSIIL